jgi:hypothetical protein
MSHRPASSSLTPSALEGREQGWATGGLLRKRQARASVARQPPRPKPRSNPGHQRHTPPRPARQPRPAQTTIPGAAEPPPRRDGPSVEPPSLGCPRTRTPHEHQAPGALEALGNVAPAGPVVVHQRRTPPCCCRDEGPFNLCARCTPHPRPASSRPAWRPPPHPTAAHTLGARRARAGLGRGRAAAESSSLGRCRANPMVPPPCGVFPHHPPRVLAPPSLGCSRARARRWRVVVDGMDNAVLPTDRRSASILCAKYVGG